MSSILAGSRDSLKAFVEAKLPKELDATLVPKKLLEEARKLKATVANELDREAEKLASTTLPKQLYVYLDKDGESLRRRLKPIRTVAEEQLAALTEGLKTLEDARIADLPVQLVNCTRAAMEINSNFAGIIATLSDLKTDLSAYKNKHDYAYDQLKIGLEELDKAAGKESEDFSGQLNDFINKGLVGKLEDIQKNIKPSYVCLRDLSLSYQSTMDGLFAELAESVKMVSERFAEITKDLNDNLGVLETQSAEDHKAWLEVKERYGSFAALLPPLEELAQQKMPATDPVEPQIPENGDDIKLMPNPDPVIFDKRKKALKNQTENTKDQDAIKEHLALLDLKLTEKKDMNDRIVARVKQLIATKKQAVSLNESLDRLELAQQAIIGAAKDWLEKMNGGEGKKNILTVILEQFGKLGEVEKTILDLNKGIQQIKVEGDIKLYFGKIAAILEQFPEPAKATVDSALAINEGLDLLLTWASSYHADRVDKVRSSFLTSAWNLVEAKETAIDLEKGILLPVKTSTKGEKKTKPAAEASKLENVKYYDHVLSELEKKLIDDNRLRYKDGDKKKKELIPITDWAGKYTFNSDVLAEWKTFFMKEQETLTEKAEIQQQEIDFLNKFLVSA